MQVVQPKPTRLKPSLSRSPCRPALSRYSATTWEPGASEVLTHGLAFRPLATALRASRPARDHHVRIGGVGAGGDGGDDHVAMAEVVIRALDRRRACRSSPALPEFAAPWRLAKPALASLSGTRSCGRLGPASEGCDVGEIERQRVGEDGIGRVGVCGTCLAPWHRPRPARRARRCGRSSQIVERLVIDREEAAGRAVFRRHVGDGGAVRERSCRRGRGRRTRRTCRPRPSCAASA